MHFRHLSSTYVRYSYVFRLFAFMFLRCCTYMWLGQIWYHHHPVFFRYRNFYFLSAALLSNGTCPYSEIHEDTFLLMHNDNRLHSRRFAATLLYFFSPCEKLVYQWLYFFCLSLFLSSGQIDQFISSGRSSVFSFLLTCRRYSLNRWL